MDLELSARGDDGCVVVVARGECDIASVSLLREQLLGALARMSARMVVDLSGLVFLDCAGASALLAASRRAILLGGTLAIAAPSAPVARLLQLTGLDRHFAVYPSTALALAAVRTVSLLPTRGGRPTAPGRRTPVGAWKSCDPGVSTTQRFGGEEPFPQPS
ncbi:MAG TPA: STAS domain-containing protein [Trebonia sp.]|nr:STAS domain-containing protein [Trebonia sp.]